MFLQALIKHLLKHLCISISPADHWGCLWLILPSDHKSLRMCLDDIAIWPQITEDVCGGYCYLTTNQWGCLCWISPADHWGCLWWILPSDHKSLRMCLDDIAIWPQITEDVCGWYCHLTTNHWGFIWMILPSDHKSQRMFVVDIAIWPQITEDVFGWYCHLTTNRWGCLWLILPSDHKSLRMFWQ